jgi:hypothetical protein
MRPSPYSFLRVGFVLVLLGLTAAQGDAQESSAALRVTVATATGEPLRGARVQVEGIGMVGITDEAGALRVSGLPVGTRTVEVGYLGYSTQRLEVALESGRTAALSFRLDPEPIALAEVRVRVRPSVLETRGFYARRARGNGTFITRAEIEEMQPRFLSDMLRQVPGARLIPSRYGARVSFRGVTRTGGCPVQYFVDGTQAFAFRIDDLPPSDVEGLEVYRGGASIPPAYNRGTAMCGVILIWTRAN